MEKPRFFVLSRDPLYRCGKFNGESEKALTVILNLLLRTEFETEKIALIVNEPTTLVQDIRFVFNLLRQTNCSVAKIASYVSVSKEFVQAVKKELAMHTKLAKTQN